MSLVESCSKTDSSGAVKTIYRRVGDLDGVVAVAVDWRVLELMRDNREGLQLALLPEHLRTLEETIFLTAA